MLRNEIWCGWLGLCAFLAGCAEDAGESVIDTLPSTGRIVFPELHSAFGGTHGYSLTPYVPSSLDEADPIEVSTIAWVVDERFVSRERFDALPGAIALTTRRTGSTTPRFSARTVSGARVAGESKLVISPADDESWQLGEERYSRGSPVDVDRAFGMVAGSRPCDLPADALTGLPKSTACVNCHGDTSSALDVEPTPTQTAGYPDERLIAIFSRAFKPAGYTFSSPFLRQLSQPDCVYTMFHTWVIDDETARGLVLKLRSLPPQPHDAADHAKREQLRAASAR